MKPPSPKRHAAEAGHIGGASAEDIVYSPEKYRETEGREDNHANAILTLGFRDGEIYILDEIYEREKDTEELIRIAGKRELSKRAVMYCDSAEPDRIQTWRRAGYHALPVKKEPGSVLAQIDYLKGRRIYIHPDCQNTICELEQWRWQKDELTGEYLDWPAEGMDDAMAALRYGVEGVRKSRRVRALAGLRY